MIFKQEAFSDNNAPLKFKFRIKKSHYPLAGQSFGRRNLPFRFATHFLINILFGIAGQSVTLRQC